MKGAVAARSECRSLQAIPVGIARGSRRGIVALLRCCGVRRSAPCSDDAEGYFKACMHFWGARALLGLGQTMVNLARGRGSCINLQIPPAHWFHSHWVSSLALLLLNSSDWLCTNTQQISISVYSAKCRQNDSVALSLPLIMALTPTKFRPSSDLRAALSAWASTRGRIAFS